MPFARSFRLPHRFLSLCILEIYALERTRGIQQAQMIQSIWHTAPYPHIVSILNHTLVTHH